MEASALIYVFPKDSPRSKSFDDRLRKIYHMTHAIYSIKIFEKSYPLLKASLNTNDSDIEVFPIPSSDPNHREFYCAVYSDQYDIYEIMHNYFLSLRLIEYKDKEE